MKFGLVFALAFYAHTAEAQSYNYDASPYKWENSTNNYRNSPYHPDNDEYGPSVGNGVYDGDGNLIGYTRSTDSGVNVFDEDGERRLYIPHRER